MFTGLIASKKSGIRDSHLKVNKEVIKPGDINPGFSIIGIKKRRRNNYVKR
jgi:hypothetical protein